MKKIMLVPLIFMFTCMAAYGECPMNAKANLIIHHQKGGTDFTGEIGNMPYKAYLISCMGTKTKQDGTPESKSAAISFDTEEANNVAFKEWIQTMAEEYYEFFRHPF
jgi:hypothetical protein